MEVPRAAAEMAAAALLQLDDDARKKAVLPAIIAGAGSIQPDDVDLVVGFWAQPAREADPSWRLASALLGGRALYRAVTAAPRQNGIAADAPNTGAMTAALMPAVALDRLLVDDGLPRDDMHITLLFHGDVEDLHPLERIEAGAIIGELASRWLKVPIELTHIAHMGPPDADEVAVAVEMFAPGLHLLRREVRDAYTRAGITWSDKWAFRPHSTLTWLPRAEAERDWPAGPLDEPIVSTVSGLLVKWGDTRIDVPLVGTSAIELPDVPTSAVTAAAGDRVLPALNQALGAVTANLRLIDDRNATAVGTAVQMGYASALDRVGRMVTRAMAGRGTTARAMSPAHVAITADAADLSSVNVESLIGPAIADSVTQVRRVLADAQLAATAEISDAFAVDLVDLMWPAHLDAAAELLGELMRSEVNFRAGITDEANLDPSTDTGDPLIAPFRITRDVLAVAGGADLLDSRIVSRDEAGRPLMGNWHGTDGVALGPYALSLVDEAIAAAGAPDAVTAEARRRPGARISDALRADLAAVGAVATAPQVEPPSGMVTVYTWELNYNGTAITNLPEHIELAGTQVLDAREFDQMTATAADVNEWPFTGSRHPGDHARCHCGWAPSIEYRIITT